MFPILDTNLWFLLCCKGSEFNCTDFMLGLNSPNTHTVQFWPPIYLFRKIQYQYKYMFPLKSKKEDMSGNMTDAY